MTSKKSRKKVAPKWSMGHYSPPLSGMGPNFTEFHVQEINFSGDAERMRHSGRIQVYSDPEGEAEKIAAAIIVLLNEKFSD